SGTVTKNETYAQVAREIFAYVLRDMTDSEGGFYSAEDADSEGVEGKFYVFSQSEVLATLGSEQGPLFCEIYGVSEAGNFREEATGEQTGLNILHLEKAIPVVAAAKDLDPTVLKDLLRHMREKLLAARNERVRPYRDDKILTDWNGLMISALAYGSQVLAEPRYADAADRAASFLLEHLARKDGRLLHRFRAGSAGILAHHDDYAFLCLGLMDLYESTLEARWLNEAKRLAHDMIRLFWDEGEGGFFLSGADAEHLITRTKEVYDGATPSGNSVATLVLLRLGHLLSDPELEEKGGECLRVFSGRLARDPMAYPCMLTALDFALGPRREVVLAGRKDNPATMRLLRVIYGRFRPNTVLAFHPMGEKAREIEALIPYLKEQTALRGEPAVYVCEGYTCKQPVTTVEELKKLLEPSPR
ncbi:thioredoxin domain-containing protein, partial [Planctomycetota bacterium]